MLRPRRSIVGITLAVGVLLGAVGSASAHPRQLAEVKQSLARFRNLSYTQRNGFGLVADLAGVTCIDGPPGEGNMGYHYGNPNLIGDGVIDRFHPEVFLYDSTKKDADLTAVEYVVLKQDWKGQGVPQLFGEDFMFVPAGNRFGLPDYYMLHVWFWKHNPSGIFNSWNPRVTCP